MKYKILGKKIKEIMKENNIKTIELVKNTGVSQGVISNIRRGDKLGRKDTIEKIINYICKTENEKKDILKAWSIERGHIDIQNEYSKIEKEADNIKKVLSEVQPILNEKKKEKENTGEFEEIEKVIQILGPNAKKMLLETVLEKYIVELDKKGKYEEAKQSIKKIKELIKKL